MATCPTPEDHNQDPANPDYARTIAAACTADWNRLMDPFELKY